MAVLYDGKEARLTIYNKKLFDNTIISGGLRLRQEPYSRLDTFLSSSDKLPFRGINISESANVYVSYRGKTSIVPNYISTNSANGNAITWSVTSFKNGEFTCYTYPNSTTTPIIGFTKYSHFVADGTNVGKCLFAMYILNNVVYITETGCDWFTPGSVSFTSGSNCYQITFRAQEDMLVLMIDGTIIYQFVTPFQGWFRPCVMSLPSSVSTASQTIGLLDYLVMSPLPCYLKEFDNYVYNGDNTVSTEIDDGSFLTSNKYAGNLLAAISNDTALNGRSQQKRYGDMYLRECQEPVSYHFTYNRLGTIDTDIDSEFAILKGSNSLLYGTILQDSSFTGKAPKSKLYLTSKPICIVNTPSYYYYNFTNQYVEFSYVEGEYEYKKRQSCTTISRSSRSASSLILQRGTYDIPTQSSADVTNANSFMSELNDAVSNLSSTISDNSSAWSAYQSKKDACEDAYDAYQQADDNVSYRYDDLYDAFSNYNNRYSDLIYHLNQNNSIAQAAWDAFGELFSSMKSKGLGGSWSCSLGSSSVSTVVSASGDMFSGISRSKQGIPIYQITGTFSTSNKYDRAVYNFIQIFNGNRSDLQYNIDSMDLGFGPSVIYENWISCAQDYYYWRQSYYDYVDYEASAYSSYTSALSSYNSAVSNAQSKLNAYNNAVTALDNARSSVSYGSSYYNTLDDACYDYQDSLDNIMNKYGSSLDTVNSVGSYYNSLNSSTVSLLSNIPIQDKDVVNVKLLPKQTSAQAYNQFRAIIDVNGYNIYQSNYETDFPPTVFLRVFENNMWSDISYTPLISTSSGFIYNTNYIIDSTDFINRPVNNQLLYMNSDYDTVYKISDTTYKYKLVSKKRYSNACVSLYVDTLSSNVESHRLITYGTDFFSLNPSAASSDYKMSTNTSYNNFNIAFEQSNDILYYINNSATSVQVTTLQKGDKVDILSYTAISSTPSSRLYVYFEVYKNGVYINRYGSVSLSQYSDRYYIGLSLKEIGVPLNGFKIKDLSPACTDTYTRIFNSDPPLHKNDNAYVSIALNQAVVSDGIYKNNNTSNDNPNAFTLGLQFDYKTGFILQSTARNVSSNCAEMGVRVQNALGVYADTANYKRTNSSNFICMNDVSNIGIIEAGATAKLWTGYGDSDQYISATRYLPFSIYKPAGKSNLRYRHSGYEAISSNSVTDSSTNRFDAQISNYYASGVCANVSFGLPSNAISTWQCARYVRCYSNGSTINKGNYWYEIQAFDVNGVNVALNKQVTTNGSVSTESGGSLSYITNGNSGDYYVSIGEGVKYLQIDLGKIYEIRKIKVWAYWKDGRTFHNKKIQISPDGTHWITVFDSDIQGEVAETSSGTTIII